MLKFSDFYHLPELDAQLAHLLADAPGLVLVVGASAHPQAGVVPPSGRLAVFRMLLHEMVQAHPDWHALVVSRDQALLRISRDLKRRIRIMPTGAAISVGERIARAAGQRPDLLVVDAVDDETAGAVLGAAASGVRVLTQLDTLAHGEAAAAQLAQFGAPASSPGVLRWIVAVQRMAALCPNCRRSLAITPQLAERLRVLDLAELAERAGFAEAPGCSKCDQTGQSGDLFLFDLYRASDADGAEPARRVLTFEEYAVRLAAEGRVAVADALAIETGRLVGAYRLVAAGEQALAAANHALQLKVTQLETANRVLEQRTAALISLQEIGHQLITSESLHDLARQICRYADELWDADRVVVYLFHDGGAELLALSGWSAELAGSHVEQISVLDGGASDERPYLEHPPGVPVRHADVEGGVVRSGVRVPLLAHGRQLGAMVVQSTRRRRFGAGEVALMRTFADQAALSMQRAGLVDELRRKVTALEAAQAALAARERLERELELAREVQQSVLPRVFPTAAGYTFAARNTPAREVGGDFYDVFRLGDERIGVVIGDVSGKGMPAALYMALARSLIFAEALRERSPRMVMANVNRLLRQLGEPRLFVTVCYGVLAPSDGTFLFCRAGHDYPLLLRDGRSRQLQGRGTVLGFFDDAELQLSEEREVFQPGDRLVLYTDGLTDVLDAAGARYNLEMLEELLCQYGHCGAGELIEATFGALAAYQGAAEQFDDMTMLVIEVL